MGNSEATNVADPSANAESSAEQTETVEANALTPEQLKATNERLLAESKKNRENALKLKKELEAFKQTQLTEQGKFKDLYESERQKNEALSKKVMRKDIDMALKLAGSQAGVKEPELLLKLGNTEFLQYDPETGSVDGVKELLEDVKKKYPVLFEAPKTPMINPAAPNSGASVNTKKGLKDLSRDEIIAQLRAMK